MRPVYKILCYIVISFSWFLYIMSYIRSALSFSFEVFSFNIFIATTIQFYSLKFCDLIILAPPYTKFQKFLLMLAPFIIFAFFSISLWFASLDIASALAGTYWLYLGYVMLILINHYDKDLSKIHPMFYYSMRYTGYFLISYGLFMYIQLVVVSLLYISANIVIISILLPILLFVALYMLLEAIRTLMDMKNLVKSKKKEERKLYMKLINDSWANEVNLKIRGFFIIRLFLLCQGFIMLILFFSYLLYFLIIKDFSCIIPITFLFFSFQASFNYFFRSYGIKKGILFIKGLFVVTPSKKVAKDILIFLSSTCFTLALTIFSLSVAEHLKIYAYIIFIYFLLNALFAFVAKIVINPKYHPRIAMILYEVFFCGLGGFTGLIAANFRIPLFTDILIIGTTLAFSTILNSLILIKLKV